MLEFLLPFAVGSLGRFVTQFFAEPVLRLEHLRREAHESILFTANVGQGARDEHYVQAITELRRLASRLDALAKVSWKPVTWWWKRRGYNLQDAVVGLIGLSNNLLDVSGARAHFRNAIERGLRLPSIVG